MFSFEADDNITSEYHLYIITIRQHKLLSVQTKAESSLKEILHQKLEVMRF